MGSFANDFPVDRAGTRASVSTDASARWTVSTAAGYGFYSYSNVRDASAAIPTATKCEARGGSTATTNAATSATTAWPMDGSSSSRGDGDGSFCTSGGHC